MKFIIIIIFIILINYCYCNYNIDGRRPPILPKHFRCKVRVFMSGMKDPYLLLYHHDEQNKLTREDYYHLVEGRHHRFYTSIKHHNEDTNYSIYHKQKWSPRACFIIPATDSAIDLSIIRNSIYLGLSKVNHRGKEVNCAHWQVDVDGLNVEYCLNRDTGHPIVLESKYYRLDFLNFEILPQPPSVFDPSKASPVKCGVIGAKDATKSIPPKRQL